MLICIYEDRATYLPGVQLLIASLLQHHPDAALRLRFPAAPQALKDWCAARPQVCLVTEAIEGAGSYNIKPHVLLDGLDQGADSCLWLDTDIIVRGSLHHLQQAPADQLIGTLDPWAYALGSQRRAQAFGLAPGLPLAGPINSAVLRVGPSHRGLLQDWVGLLRQPAYQAEQAKPVGQRHRLMLGDQDALSALLASQAWQGLDLRLLTHPGEVLHHHGAGAFSPAQRRVIGHAAGLPPLLHAMGSVKPWMAPHQPRPWRSLRDWYERLYLETSPYLVEARRYRADLTAPAPWLDVQTVLARLGLRLHGGDAVRAGTWQARLHDWRRRAAS